MPATYGIDLGWRVRNHSEQRPEMNTPQPHQSSDNWRAAPRDPICQFRDRPRAPRSHRPHNGDAVSLPERCPCRIKGRCSPYKRSHRINGSRRNACLTNTHCRCYDAFQYTQHLLHKTCGCVSGFD